METVRTETLQAQGWEKWLPESDSLGRTDLKSTQISINSYPVIALLSPGSGYGLKLNVTIFNKDRWLG